jgi:hypothetical protein
LLLLLRQLLLPLSFSTNDFHDGKIIPLGASSLGKILMGLTLSTLLTMEEIGIGHGVCVFSKDDFGRSHTYNIKAL